jgi:hypothetical protein
MKILLPFLAWAGFVLIAVLAAVLDPGQPAEWRLGDWKFKLVVIGIGSAFLALALCAVCR